MKKRLFLLFSIFSLFCTQAFAGTQKPMSIQDMMDKLGNFELIHILAVFLFPPLCALIMVLLQPKSHYDPSRVRKYIYSLLVYLVCVPGMLSCTLTGYTMFFSRQNLLDVNAFVYFFPILTMIATLVIIARKNVLADLPGVDRLYSLMIILLISFGTALAIQKTRIWIFFGGSVKILLYIAIGCFIVLKIASWKLFRKKKEYYDY